MDVQRGRIQEFRMNGWRMEMFLYMTTPEQESWWCFLESWKLQMQEHTGVEWKYLTILRASLNFSWASNTVRNKKYFLLHVWSICSDFYIFFSWLTDTKFPKMETESAYLGEEVNITCQIPEQHKVLYKYERVWSDCEHNYSIIYSYFYFCSCELCRRPLLNL